MRGFEYQRAFAVLRLASMILGQAVKGANAEVPSWLRYEWAEDVDEYNTNGNTVMWQCKYGDGWTTPTQLVELLLGFAPKLLWTQDKERERLHFRLVTSDPAYAKYHDQLGALLGNNAAVRAKFCELLLGSPPVRSDRALWQADADALGHEILFDAVWEKTRVLYVPATLPLNAGGLWPAEREALAALVLGRRLSAGTSPDLAIQALRALLATDPPLAENTGNLVDRRIVPPKCLRPIDVSDRLYPFAPIESTSRPRLTLVDRTRLEALRQEPPVRRYVARRPEWRDVVHGEDAAVGFFERSATDDVVARMHVALKASLQREGKLRLQWLVGAPGAGKSTLALRTAARLVLDGACIAVDARHSLGVEDDADALVSELLSLADGPRPVLLLLDDPLGADSAWPIVLRRLSRSSPAVVVLAATSEFLLRRHAHTLRETDLLDEISIGRPDSAEKRALARLYPGVDAQALLEADEDLLVLAMQAAAGKPFDEIIDGIWRTLSDGVTPSVQALGAQLPWEVAAFFLVVFFGRASTPCSLSLLQAFLAGRPDVGDKAIERLALMVEARGWQIFHIQSTPDRWMHAGGIVTMHARIAQRAWERRPARGWSPVDAIAAASLHAQNAAWLLARGITALLAEGAEPTLPLVDAVARVWSAPAAASATTRNFVAVHRIWSISQLPLPKVLTDALTERVERLDAESWLAALELMYARARPLNRPVSSSLPLSYEALIDTGDFSIASRRAVMFAYALSDNGRHKRHFVQRLWSAFDGKLAWQIDGSLLTWLLTYGGTDAFRKRTHALRSWLRINSGATDVRTRFLSLLQKLDLHEQRDVLQETRHWLSSRSDATDVRTHLIRLLPQLDASERREIVLETRQWLRAQTDVTDVRTSLLAQLAYLDAVERREILVETRQWLRSQNDVTDVRTSLLAQLVYFDAVERREILIETREWLRNRTDVTDVRASLLTQMAHFDAVERRDFLSELRVWLSAHPTDTSVRTRFLTHLVISPSEIADGDVADALNFLARSPLDTSVRTAAIKLLNSRNDPELPALLDRSVGHLANDTKGYQPASAALRAAASLGPSHLPVIVRWLTWAAEVLERSEGNRSAQSVATSLSAIIATTRRHLQSSDCSAEQRETIRTVLDRLTAARSAWSASVKFAAAVSDDGRPSRVGSQGQVLR